MGANWLPCFGGGNEHIDHASSKDEMGGDDDHGVGTNRPLSSEAVEKWYVFLLIVLVSKYIDIGK